MVCLREVSVSIIVREGLCVIVKQYVKLACRDIVPLGHTKSSFNYSLDDKRVLNFENVVNDDDNIKQDISIDVYGRAEKEEEAEAAAEQETEAEKVPCLITLCGVE